MTFKTHGIERQMIRYTRRLKTKDGNFVTTYAYSPKAASNSHGRSVVAGTNSAVAIHTNSMTCGYNENMVESFGRYETACKGKRKFATEVDAQPCRQRIAKACWCKGQTILVPTLSAMAQWAFSQNHQGTSTTVDRMKV
jgi:hypothetical protein